MATLSKLNLFVSGFVGAIAFVMAWNWHWLWDKYSVEVVSVEEEPVKLQDEEEEKEESEYSDEQDEEDEIRSSINNVFNMIQQYLKFNKIDTVTQLLRHVLHLTGIKEQLTEIVKPRRVEIILNCITHVNQLVSSLAIAILKNIASCKAGQESASFIVPKVVDIANDILVNSLESNEKLKRLTECLANFSANYSPHTEASYTSFFNAVSKSNLLDDHEFFGESLMKVVVNLSERDLGQKVLIKPELDDTMKRVERMLKWKQGGKDSQIRCLIAINNMLSETDFQLKSQESLDVILEYSNSLHVDEEVVKRSSDILFKLEDQKQPHES
ncbi:Oidioi.mRNA.OKI2018_I69.chr2.g5522.t1.cds [Oikopleura dioica]|uniref:Oidioi.mRNA.OKI2018_I69.chr2.g5522.t1.cds n=1 Tax=Oikopleura dioica TaxID=34765 RepID=A0ABN7T468_OIKDI|nr:Oidioi.mRNA.OKI2018_I69.chr2.g5522.t1.cds [Oikopleura dioica]